MDDTHTYTLVVGRQETFKKLKPKNACAGQRDCFGMWRLKIDDESHAILLNLCIFLFSFGCPPKKVNLLKEGNKQFVRRRTATCVDGEN